MKIPSVARIKQKKRERFYDETFKNNVLSEDQIYSRVTSFETIVEVVIYKSLLW